MKGIPMQVPQLLSVCSLPHQIVHMHDEHVAPNYPFLLADTRLWKQQQILQSLIFCMEDNSPAMMKTGTWWKWNAQKIGPHVRIIRAVQGGPIATEDRRNTTLQMIIADWTITILS